MLPTVLRRWSDVILILCGFVVFTTRRFMLSLILRHVLMFFSVLFRFVITSLREEGAGLYPSRACVCLSCMRYFLHCKMSHDKTNKMVRAPSEDSDQPWCPVWSESLLSAWRKCVSLATHWAHSEDSDRTGRMARLFWDFAGRTVIFVGFVMKRLIGAV